MPETKHDFIDDYPYLVYTDEKNTLVYSDKADASIAGTIEITENGDGIDVAQYAYADVNVSGGGTTWGIPINIQTSSDGEETIVAIYEHEPPYEMTEPFISMTILKGLMIPSGLFVVLFPPENVSIVDMELNGEPFTDYSEWNGQTYFEVPVSQEETPYLYIAMQFSL